MDLSKISRPNIKKKSKRLGRGTGSGRGKTSGRGHKGAGQRAGKVSPYIGHRGGSLPYIRIIPKRGFNSVRPKRYQIVNLEDIQARVPKDEHEINSWVLFKYGLIDSLKRPVKVLSGKAGEFTLKTSIMADAFSKKAVLLIEKANGKAVKGQALQDKNKQAIDQK